jgi:hypothetical protein
MNQVARRPHIANELNRLLQTLSRSLALYVDEIKPWCLASHGAACTAVGRLAADSRRYAELVAEQIIEAGGQPDPGAYPLKFARLNDVSLEYFLREIVGSLKADQAVVQRCVEELTRVPAARALAEEVYGNLQGHVEILEKVSAEL